VFATMVMVALMVLGLFSYREPGRRSMPNVEIPFAWVEVQYPGASPEQVENDITRPLEDAINTVSGIKTIRSNSWEGRAGVSLEFQLSTNMDKAMRSCATRSRACARPSRRSQGAVHHSRRRRQLAADRRTVADVHAAACANCRP
jgi:multidrug efflux pump subunit AcrB